MDSPFLGMIIPWPIAFAPRGWAFCQGQSLNINQNTALYSLLGFTYGGSGTTFNLPDLRGRMIIGTGTRAGGGTNYTMGMIGGSEQVTIPASALPVHAHSTVANSTPFAATISNLSVKQPVNTAPGTVSNPNNAYPAVSEVTESKDVVNSYNSSATANTFLAPAIVSGTCSVTISGNTGNAGTGQAFASMPPFLSLNYIIALEGLYPTRD